MAGRQPGILSRLSEDCTVPGGFGPQASVQWTVHRGITNHQEGRMERFKEAMGLVMVGLLPLTMCGIVWIAEILGS